MLSVIHMGTMLLGAIMLGLASPAPERVRIEALRTGAGGMPLVFRRSAISLALLLTIVSAGALFTQFMTNFSLMWKPFAVSAGNLLTFFLIFPLLMEVCRLTFNRRAVGFVALGLFVLCALPFILAIIFTSQGFAKISLLSPGVIALGDPDSDQLDSLLLIVLGQLGIAAVLFMAWWAQWKRLLGGVPATVPAPA